MNCCNGSRVLTDPAPVPGELSFLSLRSKPLATFESKSAFLLLMQTGSAPHGPRRLSIKTVGELSTGACIGTHFPQLLCRSRLRLCRRGYSLVLQSSYSALHLWLEEVSPVFHHRLKTMGQGTSDYGVDLNHRAPYGDRHLK